MNTLRQICAKTNTTYVSNQQITVHSRLVNHKLTQLVPYFVSCSFLYTISAK